MSPGRNGATFWLIVIVVFLGNEISKQNPEHPDTLALVRLLKQWELPLEKVSWANKNDFINSLGKAPSPHLLFCEESVFEGLADIEKFMRGLNKIDRGTCVFILTREQPSSLTIMDYLDKGVRGLLPRPIVTERVSEPLLEAVEKRLRTHVARKARMESTRKISIRVPSIEQALVAETVNIGSGGLFLRMPPHEFTVGETIEFKLQLGSLSSGDDEKPEGEVLIEGLGRVVWVRNLAKGMLPEGLGLQFVNLSGPSERKLEEYINRLCVKAFVPKS